MALDRRLPAVGAFTGALAYVVGYLLVYLAQGGRVRDALSGINAIIQFFGGDPIPAWKAVGWLFYNAHFVGVQYPTVGGTATANLVSRGDAPALLYAIPVVLLFAAGLASAQYFDVPDAVEGVRAGAFVTLGYVVLAIVGVFLFAVTRGGTTVRPDPVTGVLFAGLVYPLVFGSLGGAAGAVLD